MTTQPRLLDNDEILIIQTPLAVAIGDRQAIALQQIHYWVNHNQRGGKKEHFHEGKWWAYNTWAEWRKNNFRFWSVSTIRRIFGQLEHRNLILTRPHASRNNGLWVTVNYDAVTQLRIEEKPKRKRARSAQNEQTGLLKMNRPSAQNEQTSRNTENTETTPESDAAPRDEMPIPPHVLRGMGMGALLEAKNDHRLVKLQGDVYWQAYLRGWGEFEPPCLPTMYDTYLDAAAAYAQKGYKPEDIEELTRQKVKDPKRSVPYAFTFLGADMGAYLAMKQAKAGSLERSNENSAPPQLPVVEELTEAQLAERRAASDALRRQMQQED